MRLFISAGHFSCSSFNKINLDITRYTTGQSLFLLIKPIPFVISNLALRLLNIAA